MEKQDCSQITLRTGDKMPSVGYGCWKVPNDVATNCAFNAIKSGFRLIDEACDYGNEVEVGKGISMAINQGIVKREDLFVTSKLWNTYHRKEYVYGACKKSLEDLGLEYLDLYLIHFPIALKFVPFEERYPPEWVFDPKGDNCMVEDKVSMKETWQAMEELVKHGLVKNIGISNMNVAGIRELLTYAKVKPSVLQVELHPYLTQEVLLKYCASEGIAVTGFSNLGAGSYVQIGMATVQESCLNEEIVKSIAAQHKKSPAQVVLRWGIQRGHAIVPKTTKPDRMVENHDLFDFELSKEEMGQISSLNKNQRFNDPGVFCESMGLFFPIYD